MFSDEITTSDAFLDMPSGSQLLYFHLGMSADDDGFVANPKMIMRVIGASEDEYKILIAKKFILVFQNGVCVIKHWRVNNQIRKDRYSETKYIDQKRDLFVRENGAYTMNPNNALPVPKGHFSTDEIKDELEDGNHLATKRQPSIGKDRLVEDSIVKNTYGESGLVKMTTDEHAKLVEAIGEANTKLLIEELDDYLGTMTPRKAEIKYASHYKALRNWARRKYESHKEKVDNKKVRRIA